jgi:hypothetical protein
MPAEGAETPAGIVVMSRWERPLIPGSGDEALWISYGLGPWSKT